LEKELPFDTTDPLQKENLEPGYYDKILVPLLMYKDVTPFEIKTSIHNCFACDAKKLSKPLELSNFDANVMVVGETISDVDFQTKEGKLLADTLLWAKYDMNDIYFTALSKCVETETPDRCQHHLLSEILCVQPKVIIALGYDVGKHFDSAINRAGYTSSLLDKYDMLTTYRTSYAMTEQKLFEEFCNHILQAKGRVDSKLQGRT
jgi:uracil-DNA glycosylase